MSMARQYKTTGVRRGISGSPAKRLDPGNKWYRCEYCRGRVAHGEHRTILVDGETKYVHARHPRRPEEKE